MLATLAAPLFALTSTKKTFSWTPEATQAMTSLLAALKELPELRRFHEDKPTRVITDASAIGLGAVLEQQWDEEWRPVAFWSRKLKDAETRYSATDLEWMAVVDAVTIVWRHYLEDRPFQILSDHAALERKLHKSAHDPPISGRQSRWIERLMPFRRNFSIHSGRAKYRRGCVKQVSAGSGRNKSCKSYASGCGNTSALGLASLGEASCST